MSPNARQLYLLLALAADRRGLSFYGDARIQNILGLSLAEIEAARAELIDRDLLACNDQDHQLLSLRERPGHIATSIKRPPPSNSPPFEAVVQPRHTGSPGPELPQSSKMPAEMREALRTIFGRDVF
jgi:hypothetical protein